MQHRRIGMALGAVALLAMGFCGGMFFSRSMHPAMVQLASRLSCASSRQFLVEFRVHDSKVRYMGDEEMELRPSAELEVDGAPVGILSTSPAGDEETLRRFLCEGNHIAQLTIDTGSGQNAPAEVHRVEFAVSRPSLFHVKERQAYTVKPSASCVSGDDTCRRTVSLELSPYEPDDPKVRFSPSEP
jgi:hypothetical protein